MEATFDGNVSQARAAGRRIKEDIDEGVNNVKAAATTEIKSLIADVEDLIAKIADLNDADVTKVRNKVQRAIATAKESIADSADTLRQQAQRVAGSADDFVHDSPWQAVGIAALVGVLIGLVATRRS
jgi:ElaB/YqjD/DUF883 family membrane-anchored ribosome-binding protein